MTITSPELIEIMLENDGRHPGDPQAYSIHEYIQADERNVCYHVSMCMSAEQSLFMSPYCVETKLLWSQYLGITLDGRAFLARQRYKEQ